MSKASADSVKTDLWMPLWIGDYLADTMKLPRDLHGGYLLLLFAYWRERGPLPDDQEDLLAIMKGSPDEWPRLRSKVLEPFFSLEDGCWRHKRADAELVTAGLNKAAAIEKASRAATVRWERQRAADLARQANAGAPSSVSGRPSNTGAPSTAPSTAPGMPGAVLGECPSPSPPPNPTGSSSVAKATAALPAAPRPPDPPPPTAGPAPTSGPPAAPPASVPPPTPAPSSRQPVAAPQRPLAAKVKAMEPLTPEELRKRDLWRVAKEMLLELDQVPLKQAGGFLGLLHGQYPDVFLEAVEAVSAPGKRPAGGFRDYLTATCQRLAGERAAVNNKAAALEAGNGAVASAWLEKQKGASDAD